MRRLFFVILLILISTGLTMAQDGGVKKKRPLPHEYGRVVIDIIPSSGQ